MWIKRVKLCSLLNSVIQNPGDETQLTSLPKYFVDNLDLRLAVQATVDASFEAHTLFLLLKKGSVLG